MQKIAKNYIYNLLYQILVLLTPLLMTPYISRVLGAEKLGIYDYSNSIATVILTLALLGIGHYGSREIAYIRTSPEKLSYTFWNILATQILLGIIGVILIIISSFFVGYKEYILFIIWAFGTIIDCTWVFVGLEDMQHAVLKNIIAKLLFIIATLIFVKTSSDLGVYIVLSGLSTFFANLSAYYNLKSYITFSTSYFFNLKPHFKETIKLFLPLIATQLLLSLNKIMLGRFTDDISNVSYYGNAEKVVQIPLSLITVMNTVMMPRLANAFYNNDKRNVEKYLKLSMDFSLFLSFPLMVGIFIVSDSFIPWFLGEQFHDVILLVKCLSPIILINTMLGISGNQYLVASNKVKILFISNSIIAILTLFFNFLFIPKFGGVGICLATIISHSVGLMIQYIYISREIRITFIFVTFLRYLTKSLTMGVTLITIFHNSTSDIFLTCKQILVGFIVYLLVCLCTKDIMINYLCRIFLRRGF